MSTSEALAPVIHGRSLTGLAPDAQRAARTRDICRRTLVRQGHRRHRNAMRREGAIRMLTPLIVGACGLLYAAALLVTTLRLEDLLF